MKKTSRAAAWLAAASMLLSALPIGMTAMADDAANYSIANAIAGTGKSGELLLSWINPAEDVESIDIVNASGESILGDTALNTGARAVNSFNVTGLDDGTEYAYDIVYSVAGVKKSEEIKGTPQSLDTLWNTQNGYSFNGKWKLAGAGDTGRVDTKIYAYVDTTEAHSGKSSMKIVSNFDKTAYARFIDANGKWGLDSSKTYTLSLWAKTENLGIASSDFHGDRDSIQIIDDWSEVGRIGHSGEGWQHYSVELSGKTYRIPGLFIATQGTIWIDDIELYANDDETKTNLISYGSFEYDSEITREMATVDQTSAIISWKNPANGTITGIDILDESGNKVTCDTAPSTSNGALTSVKLTGLSAGETYNYTIAVGTKNGPTLKKSVTFTPGINYKWDSQNRIKLTDMTKIEMENGVGGLAPLNVEITKDAAKSGNYGMHVKSNYTGWHNINFGWTTLNSSKSYRIKASAKLEGADSVYLNDDNTGAKTITESSDWKDYSFDVSGKSYFILKINCAGKAFDNLYVDDCGIYELDSEGNEVGNNLLRDGGFEHVYGAELETGEIVGNAATATFRGYNYKIGETLNPTAILAAYKGDTLAEVSYVQLPAVATSENKVFSDMLAVGYEDGYTVKAFVWNGESMTPAGPVGSIR